MYFLVAATAVEHQTAFQSTLVAVYTSAPGAIVAMLLRSITLQTLKTIVHSMMREPGMSQSNDFQEL